MHCMHSVLAGLLLAATGLSLAASTTCKIQPTDAAWPSGVQWQTLNDSVAGQLINSSPPGQVCQLGSPEYGNATCADVRAQWPDADWHAKNPVSVDYNDFTCPLYQQNGSTCSDAGYPAYVVNATAAAHVQAGVDFAREHGIRLIVKATGHDQPGRSSGAGALSIWTHYIRGMSVNHNDPLAVKYGGIASATISAGMRWGEIYPYVAEQNVTVVGGSDPHVGVAGWTLGGGHGPLSALFGLGVDQVLSMDVVTADGKLRTVNETNDSDLFWALRGGGGSTFAAVVSLTLKAYPVVTMSAYQFNYSTTQNSDTFWQMLTYFNSEVPGLMDSTLMGYCFPEPYTSLTSLTTTSNIHGIFLAPGKSAAELEALLAPMERALNSSSFASDPIKVSRSIESSWTLADYEKTSGSVPVGYGSRLTSRLLDRAALTRNASEAIGFLKAAIDVPTGYGESYPAVTLHMVAGPGVQNALIPAGSNSVLPAWRQAYVHFVASVSTSLTDGKAPDPQLQDRAFATMRDVQGPALVDLAPLSGAYMSEADPTTPQWQQTFFGDNYGRLLDLKRKWDPQGVFWCIPCVGHELWTVTGGSAIGQDAGRICRKVY